MIGYDLKISQGYGVLIVVWDRENLSHLSACLSACNAQAGGHAQADDEGEQNLKFQEKRKDCLSKYENESY